MSTTKKQLSIQNIKETISFLKEYDIEYVEHKNNHYKHGKGNIWGGSQKFYKDNSKIKGKGVRDFVKLIFQDYASSCTDSPKRSFGFIS